MDKNNRDGEPAETRVDSGKPYDLTYISWGAGTQSTALLVMSALGLNGVPKADVAIFADVGDEPKSVYETLRFYQEWAPRHGIPVEVVSIGRLSDHIIERHSGQRTRFAAIPAFTPRDGDYKHPAMLRRQCTREYKIDPIERKVRQILGYAKGQRVKKNVRALIGITTDEVARMKPSRTRWVESCWPLIDADLSRDDCIDFMAARPDLRQPGRSACVFCPFRNDYGWQTMKDDDPESFEEACRLDEAFRDMSHPGLQQPVYVHRSLKPLRDVSFNDWKSPGQLDLFGDMNQECEGMCGV